MEREPRIVSWLEEALLHQMLGHVPEDPIKRAFFVGYFNARLEKKEDKSNG